MYGRNRYKYVGRALRAWVIVRIKYKGDTVAAFKEIKPWEMEGLRSHDKMVEAIRPVDKAFGLKLKEGRRPATSKPPEPKAPGLRNAPTQEGGYHSR